MWAKVRTGVTGMIGIVLCAAGFYGCVMYRVWGYDHPNLFLVTLVAPVAAGLLTGKIRDWRAERRLAAWERDTAWTSAPIGRPWPWRTLLPADAVVTVHRAWTTRIGGVPVLAGEISWDEGAFAGAVRGYRGRGVFVVVTLPGPGEPLAVRRPFRVIGDESRVDVPAMRAAFDEGRISPWTVFEDELFTVDAVEGRLSPQALEAAAERALAAARLLSETGQQFPPKGW